MVTDLESLFPGLAGTDYQITSPKNDVYNCIAWAAGRTNEWWWPMDAPGNYWPIGVAREETVPAFRDAFASLGYVDCDGPEWEPGFEKVAILADNQGLPTHAARQLSDGRWTSKLGKLEDIEHGLFALVGVEYGAAVKFLKRPIS